MAGNEPTRRRTRGGCAREAQATGSTTRWLLARGRCTATEKAPRTGSGLPPRRRRKALRPASISFRPASISFRPARWRPVPPSGVHPLRRPASLRLSLHRFESEKINPHHLGTLYPL
ncbi:hypothetical protein BS78_02G254000 [Paspalum vaginatum]|nr:hypothetical protein BS78_02G254000 [Paspalum vaginatum]